MDGSQHQVCLLLGSNIQPERNLPLAVRELGEQLTILRASSVWESPAVGSRGPNFLNAALLCQTGLAAEALKWQVLRPLEARLGRVRNQDKNARARSIVTLSPSMGVCMNRSCGNMPSGRCRWRSCCRI